MPYVERQPDETDGDPTTIYEDTSPHTKTGFMPTQSDITTQPSDEVNKVNEAAEQE